MSAAATAFCPASGDVCVICEGGTAGVRAGLSGGGYLQCGRCHGTFIARDRLPSRRVEREQYGLHENDPDDARYRAFVGRLVAPLLQRLENGARGLDYGCGPGPAGAAMLTQAGHRVTLYDPIFAPDDHVLEQRYDFVFCCEVAEHFHQPAPEFRKLGGLLEPGGILAVMTAMEYPETDFDTWHYRRDPTHVVFYRPDTMMHLALDHGWHAVFPTRNVVLFTKPDRSADWRCDPSRTQGASGASPDQMEYFR